MARVGRDPYPFTWEIPVALIAACGVVIAGGVHLGRAIACLVAGEGFRWPRSTEFFGSLSGVLTGDPGAGLAQAVTGTPDEYVSAVMDNTLRLLATLAPVDDVVAVWR